MNMLWLLVPISLGLGALGLALFFWSMRAGQYDDLDGAAERILFDDGDVPEEDPAIRGEGAISTQTDLFGPAVKPGTPRDPR